MEDAKPRFRDAGQVRVLEFYSGIGGARLGVEKWAREAGIGVKVVGAWDMNNSANAAYEGYFGEKVSSKGIEHLSEDEIAKLGGDLWLLSPPCQPFTLNGGKGDEDRRGDSFVHLTKVLKNLPEKRRPGYIIVENVKGFMESTALAAFKQLLETFGYATKEVTTSPLAVGVPYDRVRYYLLASAGPIQDFEPDVSSEVTLENCLSQRGVDLTSGSDALAVPNDLFKCHSGYRFTIASPSSTSVPAFTKGYGKNHRGSGALLCVPGETAKRIKPTPSPAPNIAGSELPSSPDATYRFFAPEEILALHGYPRDFKFPKGYTNIMQWKLIGNSLSVDVHARLCRMLFGK